MKRARDRSVLGAAIALFAAVAYLADHIVGGAQDIAIRSAVPTQFVADPVRALTLDCLTPQLVESVRASRSIDEAFRRCEGRLRGVLGAEFAHLERPDLRAIFAVLVAQRMAPYGPSRAVELDDLLKAPALACDNYMLLAAHLAGEGMSLVAYRKGDPLGTHAQIFYARGGVRLLLDPTVALVALADFDALMAGGKVPAKSIRHFYAGTELVTFLSVVLHGLLNGKYRRAELIYVYDSLDQYRRTAGLPALPRRPPQSGTIGRAQAKEAAR